MRITICSNPVDVQAVHEPEITKATAALSAEPVTAENASDAADVERHVTVVTAEPLGGAS